MRRREWLVTLYGKWGGLRTVRVQATTPERARAAARDFAYSYERIGDVVRVQSQREQQS
jgi:hypothetical protein